MRRDEREGYAVAGLGAEGRRHVSAGAEAPPARAPTPLPFVQRRAWGSLQLGERSGDGGESRGRPGPRAARSACAPRSALGSSSGARGRAGCFGRRAGLIVRQVRGWPASGRVAKVGGGRARGGGRRVRARLVVGVCIFFLKTSLGRAGVAFRPPGPAGDVRAAAAADAGLRAARSLQLVSSIVAEPVSHFASPLVATPLTGRLVAPHPAPRDPRLAGRSAEHPAGRAGWGRRGGGTGEGAGLGSETCRRGGELREPPRRSRAARRNAWIHRPGAVLGSPAPCPRGGGNELSAGNQPRALGPALRPSSSPHTLWAVVVSLSLFPLP